MLKETNYKFYLIQQKLEDLKVSYSDLYVSKVVPDREDKSDKLTLDRVDRPENIPKDHKFCYICGKVLHVDSFFDSLTRCKQCHYDYVKYNKAAKSYHK